MLKVQSKAKFKKEKMIKKKKFSKKIIGISITILILILLSGGIGYYFFGVGEKGDFDIDRLFIKNVLKEGASTYTSINIYNKNSNLQEFSIKINEIEDLVSIEEKKFNLKYAEEKDINIEFKVDNDTNPGIYLGNIEVISAGVSKKVPIILEVQTEEVLFSSDINIIPQGKDLLPGQKLNAEIKIFNLENLDFGNIELIYFIKDFLGRTIVSESEDVVIEGSSLGISKTLDLPSNLRLGDYVFIVITKYDSSVGTSSRIFKVSESVQTATIGSDSNSLLIIVLVFGFFFMVFLVLLIYSIFYRDKLLIELQKQYKSELKRQNELIREGEKQAYVKLKTAQEQEEYKKEAEKVGRQRILALKEVQKQRVQEFKKIKKLKNIFALKAQMNKWKKQGYNTQILENRFKLPAVNSIKKKISGWKRQGYDTSVLEDKLKK